MLTSEQTNKWKQVFDTVAAAAPPQAVDLWLSKLELVEIRDRKVVVRVTDENPMVHTILRERYRQQFESITKMVFGMEYDLTMLTPAQSMTPAANPAGETGLNKRYSFDNFIVGDSNKLAYAAAMAVAELPGRAYNPLFVYGDVGLGKTHLINAIGNYAQDNMPSIRVRFITSENMANELIERLRQRKDMDEYRSAMRDVDILIVDDIQFLSKTTSTQEEFFNTFNELYQAGKQIVISSDRPPKEIPTIEDRLRSRFEWGLTVDIRKPNFETRMAILRNKAEEDGIDAGDDVMEFIAQHCTSSIRELEGALTRVQAHSELLHEAITLEMARETLSNLIRATGAREITAKLITQTVGEYFGIGEEEIRGKKRSADIARARHIAIYLCRTLTDKSTTMIGREFGGRDHTTVMSSVNKIKADMASDPETREAIRALEKKIREM